MSGIFDQIINYSPPLIVSGTVNYKGTWNASTNNPPLSNPPVASTKGDYYVVSTAGTQFSITFGVGDWIISNGTAWEKVDLTDAVSSVFGRTGAVVGDSTDYSAVGLTNTAIGAANPSTGAFTSLSSSSTTTLNGTTIPALKTLVVTTDKLSALAATTSAELAGVISDETGSGSLVFANSPTLVTPALGTPSSGTVTNLTGTASININGTVGATTPSTGVFTGLTVNDNSTLGSSNTDTVTFNARVASDINPSADDTYDLGVTGHEWRNLNIDGTANIDSLVADTADINGGTIDGTTVGATTPSTGAFTGLTASSDITIGTGGTANVSNGLVINSTSASSYGSYISMRAAGVEKGLVSLKKVALGGSSNDLLLYSNSDNVVVYGGGSLSGTFSSTGLAVTGAVSGSAPSAGATTFTATSNDVSGINHPLYTFQRSGGAVAGEITYEGVGATMNLWTTTAHNLVLGYNRTAIAAISSSGVAVTGALSSTGAATVNGTIQVTANTTPSSGSGLEIQGGATPTLFAYNRTGSAYLPLVFTGSTLSMKMNNVDAFTLTGASAAASTATFAGALAIGNTVNTVTATLPNRTITMVIGGTTYYIHAKTTND